MELERVWKNSFEDAESVLKKFYSDSNNIKNCLNFTKIVHETIVNKGNIFVCGNGGSHCDAMHFCEEWTGRFRKDREAIGALALGDAAHMSCVANDWSFDLVFSLQ